MPPKVITASSAWALRANRMKGCGCFHAPSPPFSTQNGWPFGLSYSLFSSSSR